MAKCRFLTFPSLNQSCLELVSHNQTLVDIKYYEDMIDRLEFKLRLFLITIGRAAVTFQNCYSPHSHGPSTQIEIIAFAHYDWILYQHNSGGKDQT